MGVLSPYPLILVKIKRNQLDPSWSKGTVFFSFPLAWTLAIHSFKSENRVFLSPIFEKKKKQRVFFFSCGKVHWSFIQILMKFPFF